MRASPFALPPVARLRVGGMEVGGGAPLALVAGPCVIEGEAEALAAARAIAQAASRVGMPFLYKSSYDKANRTSIRSYRGPGLEKGLQILEKVRREVGVPVLSDVHLPGEVPRAAEVLDVLQVPAFLCRQTDLVLACGRAGKPVNVKKGQFLSPPEMRQVVEKLESVGCREILLTERGAAFGYQDLVFDPRSLLWLAELGYPVVFDASHSLQRPGGLGSASGGDRAFIPHLARAAVACGCHALFIEVHPEPDRAPSDGPNMLPLRDLEPLLREVQAIDRLVRGEGEEGGP
ncbi:MAG: 3-deoxy-8-phosphooctulonate synthase [Nitrospinota bacterium]